MSDQSGTERALIAVGMKGTAIVLSTDGPWLAFDVEEISSYVDDIGLCDVPEEPGLYLFEGKAHSVRYSDGDFNTTWTGTVSHVSPAQVLDLLAMRPPEAPTTPAHEGDWGALPGEPCRFCRQPGGVFFMREEGPEGGRGLQSVRCDKCGRDWIADSSSA